ncbi:hypothetical protein RSAG8_08699, partial [Rhizoctonia solani AG-8 WAC10335]
MAFVNNYVPPPPKAPVTLPDPSKPYDVNFCFPVSDLETDRVKLTPFIAAERLGFKLEGVIRWQRPLPAERESSAPFRSDDSLGLPGRHTAMLAICWDDWENGGMEHLQRLIDRKA